MKHKNGIVCFFQEFPVWLATLWMSQLNYHFCPSILSALGYHCRYRWVEHSSGCFSGTGHRPRTAAKAVSTAYQAHGGAGSGGAGARTVVLCSPRWLEATSPQELHPADVHVASTEDNLSAIPCLGVEGSNGAAPYCLLAGKHTFWGNYITLQLGMLPLLPHLPALDIWNWMPVLLHLLDT